MAPILFDDRTVDFILHDVLDVDSLTQLPHYSMHTPETLRLSLDTLRKLSREVLFPSFRTMDNEPPEFKDGRVHTHPLMKTLWGHIVESGFLSMTRPLEVDGQQLPKTVAYALEAYGLAGNLSATCFVGLTTGAAGLIESFGSDELKEKFMKPMYAGRYTGTMALTEPHAGSSLADVRTKAIKQPDGTYKIEGSKVFISGGDNTFSENIVHLALARIEGAPVGTRGVSLFAVPRLREENGKWVDNDAKATGLFHKMGWKALPSIALQFGEEQNCVGYMVGEPNQGLRCMFQMMNGARLAVGMGAVATASAAYHVALEYAKTRPQGRAMNNRDANTSQIPIIEHADVRRMLLAQKAIVEGGLSLLLTCANYQDLADAANEQSEREKAQKLLDLLTPLAKTIPAERGFDANALAVQVHGGYGYTSEYLPELYLREQKLNTLHEGTTGIQSLDLLGRKVMSDGGMGVGLLAQEIQEDIAKARKFDVLSAHAQALDEAVARWADVLATLGSFAQGGDFERAMSGSVWHLEMASAIVMAWQWLRLAHKAQSNAAKLGAAFVEGKTKACAYWFEYELPKSIQLAALLKGAEPSYAQLSADAF